MSPAADTAAAPSDRAYLSPTAVDWAIRRSGMSVATLAARLKVDTLTVESWRRRDGSHPSFAKARQLATLLRVPFGYLYLKTPPDETLPLPDFRGFKPPYAPSAELRDLLNSVLLKRDWYRQREQIAGAQPLKFIGSCTPNNRAEDVARLIRERLEITPALRASMRNWSEYVSTLSKRAEAAGVLVMRSSVVGNNALRKIRREELLGFAISDDLAPLVFVNASDHKSSQVFTLAHELAHLWIGESALGNPDELDEDRHNRVEQFCNQVAAEVLVPQAEFQAAWAADNSPDLETRVERLARAFRVSAFVVLRRARETRRLSPDDYVDLKRREFASRRREQSAGGDYYRNILARMGGRLTEAVLSDLSGRQLEYRDGATLLSMKVPALSKFVEKWK